MTSVTMNVGSVMDPQQQQQPTTTTVTHHNSHRNNNNYGNIMHTNLYSMSGGPVSPPMIYSTKKQGKQQPLVLKPNLIKNQDAKRVNNCILSRNNLF